MLTYQCCSLNPPDDFVNTVNDLAFKFLWNNKPDKVKRKTIIADYNEGGLKMLDIKTFIKAQKIMWVKRLYKEGDASWKAYPQHVLNKLIGKNSFKCNLNINKKPNINEFYWSIIKDWMEIQEQDTDNMSATDIRRQCLWLNINIKINKEELRWNDWIQNNILLIHDIVDSTGTFLTINEIERIYGLKCNFMRYNSLKDAVPKEWREKLKTIKVPRDSIQANDDLTIEIEKQWTPINLLTNKIVYWKMINKIKIPHVTKEKWENELNIQEGCWKQIFNIPMLIRDTKIRAFQYKVIMNLIPCNLYLFRIGKQDTDTCNYCHKIDNITHFFCDCPNTKQFWLGLQNWWNTMKDESITLTKQTVLMGDFSAKTGLEQQNAIIQLARWYIYCEKMNLQEPFFYRFLTQLRYKLKIEKIICLRNGNIKKYTNMWEEIEEYIE
jgi:hypothetical protein